MKHRILLVEDDDKARRMLAYLLQHTGYHVTQAANGEQALDVLERESFDVVLTDIVMGDVDGIEVLHTARLQPYRPSVILLTGHGTLDTCISALRAGASDYLLKPCTDEDLLACIDRALQRHQAERQLAETAHLLTTLYQPPEGQRRQRSRGDTQSGIASTSAVAAVPRQVGALAIGASRKRVTFDGQLVHLTPIEYALLYCLAETPGTARTYSDIVQHTHNLDLDEAEAQVLLRVHISNLRKKLPTDYIVNHRGTGYMLIDPPAAQS